MKVQYIVFVLTSVVFVNFLAEGYKVTCYMCDSAEENCPEKNPPTSLRTYEFHPNTENRRTNTLPACRKLVSVNTATDPPTITVRREGGDIKTAVGDGCETRAGPIEGITWTTCWCKTNYCNGSSSNSPMSRIIVALCALGMYACKLFSS